MNAQSMDETEGVLPTEDSREQVQDRIAELVAELSEATDTPEGFQPCAPFAPGDVSFDSDSWMSCLADVQGWLHLGGDLSTTDPTSFITALVDALSLDGELRLIERTPGIPELGEQALERLSERAELAARLQQAFLADLEADGGSRASASASWNNAWSDEEDGAEDVTPDPVTAKADVWPIFQLTKKKLNLTPSYQRGDVWRTADRQALIESILRGIPLPSIILLRTGATTPHDVVDGKQRLTALLRFVGQHPIALARVSEAHDKYPNEDLLTLFETDYPQFRRVWKRCMGQPLTAKLEDDYYFPFKLRSDEKGGLVGEDLEPLRGRYFTEILDKTIRVADQEVTIDDLFRGAPDYKVPVIEYTKASQRQIHEVFKLYNKQGMHLNAEEIRNAIYHDVELTRAILVAAGDVGESANIADVAPSLEGVVGIDELGKTLADYGFGEARYRRTKVLGWIVATLIRDTEGKRLPSTARHTDLLLGEVQGKNSHPLHDRARIADLFGWIAQAAELHAAHDELWPDAFRGDGKSSKWQDLQLVGSLVGIAVATAGAPSDIEERIEVSAESICTAALSKEWRRPTKTQTRTQWDHIAKIVRGIVQMLDVDISAASREISARFGSSGIESLMGSLLTTRVE